VRTPRLSAAENAMTLSEQVAVFVSANFALAGPFCALAALLGSLLGTNLIVPAGAVLTAMGVLVGAGVLPWTIVLWGACGAIAGMSVSYTLGVRLGSRTSHLGRFQSAVMERAEALFARYGFAAILIGYFSGPLRAPMACVAAIAGMRRARFELANIASAFIWAMAAVGVGAGPGALAGPNQLSLLVVAILVPALMIGVSAGILFLRKLAGKRS
jgi:membrane protein DedA with SNARE-associated domain